MSEEKVNHLFKAASLFSRLKENKSYDILKSHYLMRCPILSTNNILDGKRCSHCCLEFRKSDKCKTKSIKLSKKQRQQLKAQIDPNVKNTEKKSNQLEITCSFCDHVNKITCPKFQNKKAVKNEKFQSQVKSDNVLTMKTLPKDKVTDMKHNAKSKRKEEVTKNSTLNVYSKASEVFSMRNDNNKLIFTKEPVQIKNNKKKKDKFAGLCQKAVSAAAKIKENKDKNNRLNLFLKPSV